MIGAQSPSTGKELPPFDLCSCCLVISRFPDVIKPLLPKTDWDISRSGHSLPQSDLGLAMAEFLYI